MSVDSDDQASRQSESLPARAGAPSLWTLILPVLAGAVVYYAITEFLEADTGTTVWSEELLETSPALLIGFLFETFVLMPLWELFARLRARRLLAFAGVSVLIWLLCSAVILGVTHIAAAAKPSAEVTVILPGIVIVLVFVALVGCRGRRP